MNSRERVQRKEREHAELLTLFAAQNSAIHAFQERQWRVAYYTLLLFAGVLAISQIVLLSTTALYFMAVLVWAIGWHVLDKLEDAIKNAREGVDIVIFSMSVTFQKANYPPSGVPTPIEGRTTLRLLFRVVLTVGLLAVLVGIFFYASGI